MTERKDQQQMKTIKNAEKTDRGERMKEKRRELSEKLHEMHMYTEEVLVSTTSSSGLKQLL